MTNWTKYNGSPRQIAEMLNPNIRFALPKFGYLYNYENFDDVDHLRDWFSRNNIKEYLICNPHPLADMIIRQAATGQPVWVKRKEMGFEPCEFGGDMMVPKIVVDVTTRPDWNIPGAEYRFTPFEEVEK